MLVVTQRFPLWEFLHNLDPLYLSIWSAHRSRWAPDFPESLLRDGNREQARRQQIDLDQMSRAVQDVLLLAAIELKKKILSFAVRSRPGGT